MSSFDFVNKLSYKEVNTLCHVKVKKEKVEVRFYPYLLIGRVGFILRWRF